jgi:probable addiction module antidote protein
MNKKMKKINNYSTYDEWVIDVLRHEKDGADKYIKVAFEEYSKDGDEKALLVTLRQATKAKMGFKGLAEKTGLSRESLYRALSPSGNPRLNTIKLVLSALGYDLTLQHHRYVHAAHQGSGSVARDLRLSSRN